MKKLFYLLLTFNSLFLRSQVSQLANEWVFENAGLDNYNIDTLYNTKSQVIGGDSVLSLNIFIADNYYRYNFILLDSSGTQQWSTFDFFWLSGGGIFDFKVHNDTIYVLTYYTNPNNPNYKDIAVRKLDLSGNFISYFTIPGDYNFWPFFGSQGLNHARQRNLFDISTNGEIYIAALIIEGTTIGNTVQSTNLNISNNNDCEVVLLKTDLNGNILNVKKMGNEIGCEGINSIYCIDNKVFVSMYFTTQQPIFPQVQNNPSPYFGVILNNQFGFLSAFDSTQYIIPGQLNIYSRLANQVQKRDLLGNVIWTREFSDISDFSVNNQGDYIVSGKFSTSVDVTTQNVGDEFIANNEFYKIFLCKYNDFGSLLATGSLSTFYDTILNPNGAISIKTTSSLSNKWYCFGFCSFEFDDINPLELEFTSPQSGRNITLKLDEQNCNPTNIDYGTITGCNIVSVNGVNYNSSGNYTQNFGCDSIVNFQIQLVYSYDQDLCSVSADSTSTNIIVVWEKPNDISGIDSYNIYRETSLNNYTLIANRPIDSLSKYIDITANPNSTSFRYKVSTVNPCGEESWLSSYHSSIHLQFLGNGNFQWSNYLIEGGMQIIDSYDIFRDDFGTGNFQLLSTISGSNNTFTDVDYFSFPLANYRVVGNLLGSYQCNPNKNTNSVLSNIRSINLNSIDEINPENIYLHPNPTNSKLTIEISNGLIGNEYTIIDFSGRELRKSVFNSAQEKIELTSLSNGVYFIQVRGSNIQQRIIKQ